LSRLPRGGPRAAPGTVVATSKTITVTTLGGALYELDETVLVNLTSPTNAVLGDAQVAGTIANDDAKPTVSIGDASIVEGATETTSQLVFTLTLSAPGGIQSRVGYATANGTAIARSDYSSRGGTLSIPVGGTSRIVSVTIRGDATIEPDEMLLVNLSAPINVAIGDGTAVGTILNDD
jgi:hypothetical protein